MRRFSERWPAIMAFALLAAGLTYNGLSVAHTRKANAALARRLVQIDHKADYAANLAEFGDRVIDLPQDAHSWHTSVFTKDVLEQRERQLLDWFSSDPQLVRLRQQTHFHHYTPRSAVYSRYGNVTASGLPVILLQDATGQVIYKVSGDNLPRAPWPLVRGIIDSIRAHCPHCPRPKPAPEPVPEPEDAPVEKPLIPDILGPNQNTPSGRDDTLPVTVAVFVGAIAIGFLAAARRNGRSVH